MSRWRCWRPDYGETREDADDVEAADEQEAARKFAEERFPLGDPFHSLDVRVAAWGSGCSSEVDVLVNVEVVPEFWAERPRPVTP